MNAFASLTNRIFFATALLAVLSISLAVYVVNRAVTRRSDQEIQRSIEEAKGLVDHYRSFTFDAFGRDARFIAEIPMLQAAVDTHNPATVEPLAREYQPQFQNADLFAIADNTGRVLVRLGTSDIPEVFHRFVFRRGNLVAMVQTVGAQPYMSIDQARNTAILIDGRATGNLAAYTPTPEKQATVLPTVVPKP